MTTGENMMVRNAENLATEDYQEPEIRVDLMELFYRLLDKAWLILLVGVVAAVLAVLYTHFFVDETYTATTKIYVIGEDTAIDLTQLNLGDKMADDYVEVFRNRDVHSRVAANLLTQGYELPDYKTVKRNMSVTQLPNTRILSISYECGSRDEAVMVVNEYAQTAIQFISVKMGAQVPPTVFEAPYASSIPTGPSKVRNGALAMIAAMALVALIISCQFIMDDRIRTSDQLENRLGLPTLGMMPIQQTGTNNRRKEARA